MQPTRTTLLLLALALSSCSRSGPPTYAVGGLVTLDGKPIPEGTITFRPREGSLRPEGAAIQEGQFALRLPAGAMRVEISASRASAAKPVLGMGPTREEYIPPEYAGPATVLTADVTATATNRFEFKLHSDGRDRARR